MLDDHSSRWSAAASPGGLIGMILTILSVMVVVASILSLTGGFELDLSEPALYALLGASTFTTFILIYLLISYVTIRYRLDPERLSISWGLWRLRIPYDEIEAVEPATDVLGEQAGGWVPFWPGYYVGALKTDVGDVQVVATLPPRRQILISRTDGEIVAISPERPLLFMEELSRWHARYHSSVEEVIDPEPSHGRAVPVREQKPPSPREFVLVPEPEIEPEPSEPISQAPPLAVPEASFGASAAMYEEEQTTANIVGVPSESEIEEPTDVTEAVRESSPDSEVPSPAPQPPSPTPAFGAVQAADEPHQTAPKFGTVAPDVEHAYAPPGAVERDGADSATDEDADTGRIQIWPQEATSEEAAAAQPIGSPQQFVDAGWTAEHPAAELAQTSPPPFAPPQPVILPSGPPRSQVLQPLTRVHRAEPVATSPAIRPMIHRDPVALSFIGIGALTTVAMVVYLLIQWDDIPPSLTLHWNVDGMPGRVGEPREIWVLPMIAALVLVANVGLAWSIAQFDRFAARLMLSSTLIVHLVTWVALLMILQ